MFRPVTSQNDSTSMVLSTGTTVRVLSCQDEDHTQAWYVIAEALNGEVLEFGVSDEMLDAIVELVGDLR